MINLECCRWSPQNLYPLPGLIFLFNSRLPCTTYPSPIYSDYPHHLPYLAFGYAPALTTTTTTTTSLIPLGEIKYMDHMTAFGSIKNQMFRNTIYHDIFF